MDWRLLVILIVAVAGCGPGEIAPAVEPSISAPPIGDIPLYDQIRKERTDREAQSKMSDSREITQLRKSNEKMAKTIAAYRHGMGGGCFAPAEIVPTPKVDGIVLATNPQGLVEISLGSDDGVREGLEMEVYRATKGTAAYLGRIVIRKTKPERAVGEILKEYLKVPIQTNDRVFTRVP